MNIQLKSDSEFILKWAQKEKREFTINKLSKSFMSKFPYEAKFPHIRIEYTLNYLVSDNFLKKDSQQSYNLETKGIKFNNWTEIETVHELEQEKKKQDLQYIKKLNKDYKKNQLIVIASTVLAILSAIAAIVSAAKV